MKMASLRVGRSSIIAVVALVCFDTGSAGASGAQFPPFLSVSSLDGINGFRIEGGSARDQVGNSVAGAGDVNGDGIADLIIGAPGAAATLNDSGAAYVVFGRSSGFGPRLITSALDGHNGFRIGGNDFSNFIGTRVARAGDVNGDGLSDVLVAGPYAGEPNQGGSTYIVFGKHGSFPASLAVADLDGTNGFRIDGLPGDYSVGMGGADLNGDGFADIVVAEGSSLYVVLGKATPFRSVFRSSDLNGRNGFRISGTGCCSASKLIGDINGDGIKDLIVSAADIHDSSVTSVYVIFGRKAGFPKLLRLSDINGENGFRLNGSALNEFKIGTGASAGDINGDGLPDIVIDAIFKADGASYTGAFVVFGQEAGFPADNDLAAVDGSNGFRIVGPSLKYNGGEVSGAGDVNGDGLADILVSAPYSPNATKKGDTYVLFGRRHPFPKEFFLSTLDGSNGFTFEGAAVGDHAGEVLAGSGDINDDGKPDILIGSRWASPRGQTHAGAGYVIFGR